MIDSLPAHSADRSSGLTELSLSRPTAGQRTAADALRAAIAARQPLILVFGDMGSGKTTLLNSVLNTANPDEFIVVNLSATSGEFLGPPTFDNLLEAICRRLVVPQPAKQRPATLAALATTVSAFDNGRILLLAIDHADHLTDEVIAEVTRLAEYLDISPANLVCVFVGSLSLASRIDSVLRCQGADQRLAEIRLLQPSAEELAALLAYKDTAQPEGPMLTPEAIGRISIYAKSNLHRAVPMADAARSLAESDGKREITPEMVRAALLEIWSPEQPQPSNSLRPNEQDALRTSHLAPALPPRSGAEAAQGAEEGAASTHGADPNSSASTPPISPEDPGTSDAGVMAPAAFRRRVLRVAPVAFVLLIAASALTFILHERTVDLGLWQPRTVAQEAPHPEPSPNVLPVEPLYSAFNPWQQQAFGSQADQTFIIPSVLPPYSAFNPWQQQAFGSQADQTFIIPPVLPNIAPQIVVSWDEPSPDENTSKKKVSDEKARKQINKDVTSKNWIQTR